MRADTLTLKTLFQRDVRYLIPTFQRPYVWSQEQQWEPLWEDVRNTAERFLDELDRANGNVPQAEERVGSHFLGAVVLQQRPTAAAELESRDVIDGQQRLTTLQLFLDAAEEVLREIDDTAAAKRMSRLVLNSYAEGDDVFKLWPTSLDRDAFRAAMTNTIAPVEFEESRIVQAHDFFRLQIREWFDAAEDVTERGRRVQGLETAVFGLLELVVIDLATADDAFVIFETLNARGTPLLASDLVKNYTLQTAAAQGLDVDAIYQEHWRPLDDPWWREEVSQGRILRPRIDVYLNYWLVMLTAGEVKSNQVFPRFRALIEADGVPVQEAAAELARVAPYYRTLEATDDISPLGTFLHRWRIIDAGSSTPLVLWLLSTAAPALTDEQQLACLRVLESFLVRRMVCRLTTKDYNRLFLELLSRTRQAQPDNVVETFVGYLTGQSAESRRWPDDREVERALLDLPLYRLLTRARLRFVLEAVEDSLRSHLSEEAHVRRGSLTIEHVMPQAWKQHWKAPAGIDPDADPEVERERLLHTIGNLTLVNGRLNPTLSNGGWETKQALLAQHTVLHMNKELLAFAEPSWDEMAIRKRGRSLADRFIKIWPRIGPLAVAGPPATTDASGSPPGAASSQSSSGSVETSGASSRRSFGRSLENIADGTITYRSGGIDHEAVLVGSQIQFADGRSFTSLSSAARAVNGGTETNGWHVWKRDGHTLAELHDADAG